MSEARLFIPRYRPIASGDWSIRLLGAGVMQGYWSDPQLVRDVPILLRGAESWMSLTPLEIESEEIGILAAKGHVLIFGLGMGWATMAVAARPEVTAVTVVERDGDVLALHRALDLPAQLDPAARGKIRIVRGDAHDYRPDAPVDLLFPDIWLPLVGGDRFDEVRRMQANVGARSVYFWGQEMELARHARAGGHDLDAAGIAAAADASGLPLIGLDQPDYAGKVEGAAARWMRGRWL